MIRILKRLCLGLPKHVAIIAITYGIISGGFIAVLQYICAMLVLDNIEDFYVSLAVLSIIYIGIWSTTYFFGENFIEMSDIYINNYAQRYYYNKLYKIKPEILKQNSTGYICALVQKTSAAQAECLFVLTDSTMFRLGKTMFVVLMMFQYSAVIACLLLILQFLGCFVRIYSHYKHTSKYIKTATMAESMRDQLYVDILQNINTIQKTQAIGFTLDKVDQRLDNALTEHWKWQYSGNFWYTVMRVTILLWVPLSLLYCYVTGNMELLHMKEMWALVGASAFPAVDAGEGVSKFLRRYDRFHHAHDMLTDILDNKNIRKDICKKPFTSLVVNDCIYQYTDNSTKTAVTVEIPKFELKRGDRVCIQGVSGQGKTTLLNIMSQEIETPNVIINSQYNDQRLDCVFVSQDTEILDMSLRDNLLMGYDADDSYLEYLLCQVGLYDWFKLLPDGFDTCLGERGVFVSSGQRQRINLLRGLLQINKDVYLLDEPTSNLDDETEGRVIKLIEEILHEKTIVIVTHRPAIKKICNKFYTFRDGCLYED